MSILFIWMKILGDISYKLVLLVSSFLFFFWSEVDDFHYFPPDNPQN